MRPPRKLQTREAGGEYTFKTSSVVKPWPRRRFIMSTTCPPATATHMSQVSLAATRERNRGGWMLGTPRTVIVVHQQENFHEAVALTALCPNQGRDIGVATEFFLWGKQSAAGHQELTHWRESAGP